MTNNPNWQQISKQIERATGLPFAISTSDAVSGGCINAAYSIQSTSKSYFVKLNSRDLAPMFEAELLGLNELAQAHTIKVPKPILCGVTDRHSFIVLEQLSLASTSHQAAMQKMGQQLAQLHQIKQDFFGWQRNNTIGSTEQNNESTTHWIDFWRDKRLNFQLALANANGYGGKLTQTGDKLAASLPAFFTAYNPHPALLHGDLWSGNAAVTNAGEPVIYDPACYYGDREADIAMTELFGGFSPSFYTAYNETYPLDAGYPVRKTLYNLYHILNHLNLFGAGYLNQAQNMIDTLLAEIS